MTEQSSCNGNLTMIGRKLQQANYYTAQVGKWHQVRPLLALLPGWPLRGGGGGGLLLSAVLVCTAPATRWAACDCWVLCRDSTRMSSPHMAGASVRRPPITTRPHARRCSMQWHASSGFRLASSSRLTAHVSTSQTALSGSSAAERITCRSAMDARTLSPRRTMQ